MPNGFDDNGEEFEEIDTAAKLRDLIREAAKERAKQAMKKAVTEPIKKAAKEAGKKVVMAAGKMMAKAALAAGKALIATFPYWGPVVGIIILVIIVIAVFLSANSEVCGQLSGEELKAVQQMQGEAGTSQCGSSETKLMHFSTGKNHGIFYDPDTKLIWTY